MPVKNAVPLNTAARDVVAERQRQVSTEGYSLHLDDIYVKHELAQAAACYASCAGQPNVLTTQWPWASSTWKPSSDRRRDLVKAGALILAEIERIDRTKLIQRALFRRDADGMFTHPEIPNFDEDHEAYRQWLTLQGLTTSLVAMECDAPEEVSERYFKSEAPDCSYWEPSRPEGEGWFALSLHDTEDGPVCVWARREMTP